MLDYLQLNDIELIVLCLENDADAWETLIRRYQRLIASITFKFKLTAEDSADIFQAVCLTLLQQMPQLKKEAKLSSWLITVTVRECWKLRERSKKAPVSYEEELPPEADIPSTNHQLAETDILQVEQQQFLRRGLELVSEQCRHLLEQLFYRETPAPYAEISRQLGIPVASIGPTRARCLSKLKESLKNIGFF